MEFAEHNQLHAVMQLRFGTSEVECNTCAKILTHPSKVYSKNYHEYFPSFYCRKCIRNVSDFVPASNFMRTYEINGFQFIIFSLP